MKTTSASRKQELPITSSASKRQKLKKIKHKNAVKPFRRLCDTCEKFYLSCDTLNKHKKNVHLIDFTGKMYCCDLCPVKKPTKRLIYDHFKSVHIIDWQACNVCGKEFKSKRLCSIFFISMKDIDLTSYVKSVHKNLDLMQNFTWSNTCESITTVKCYHRESGIYVTTIRVTHLLSKRRH